MEPTAMDSTPPVRPARASRPWTLGMVVVAGAVLWCIALGPVVAFMSGGQISLSDGWFALGQVAGDPATSDAAMPGLATMLAVGGAGLAVAALVRALGRLRRSAR